MNAAPSIALGAVEEKLAKIFLEAAQSTDTVVRIAGGWVRDKLLGKPSDDIDIALDNASGEEFASAVKAVLSSYGYSSGSIGTIAANPEQSKHLETATMRIFDLDIDFVNLRSEAYIEDSRIPLIVFGTAEEDARRRDFTINSMFFNLNTATVEDLTGQGLTDLANHVIRTPLDPFITFKDDPLRVLRGVRFAARYMCDLSPDIATAATSPAIKQALLDKVSRERVMKELDGMLGSSAGRSCRPVVALGTLHRLAVFDAVFVLPRTCDSSLSQTLVDRVAEICAAGGGTSALLLPPGADDWQTRSLAVAFTCSALLALLTHELAHMQSLTVRLCSASDPTLSPSRLSTQTAPMLVCIHAQTLTQSLPEDRQYRCLYLSASLFGMSHLITTEKKKVVNLACVCLRDGLKADNEAMKLTGLMLDTWSLFTLYSLRGCSRVEAGYLLRKAQTMWRECLLFACAVELASKHNWDPAAYVINRGAVSDFTLDSGDIALIRRYRALEDHIELGLSLDDCWSTPPLLDGTCMISELGLKKGPLVGVAMEEQVSWMLANPLGDRAALVLHLRSFMSERS